MMVYLAPGVQLVPLEDTWAAYGALSGETLQLNTEAAAIIEHLQDGPRDVAAICEALASDTQTEAAAIDEALRHVWAELLAAGLIRLRPDSADSSW
jgi:PqqD family protein of HPr-rel-A system